MSYRLVLLVTLGKGTGRFHTIASDINPKHALEIGLDKVQEAMEITVTYRQKYRRPYKMMPKYLRFYLMSGGQPNVEKTRMIGQFEIPLDGSEPKIVKEWR